MTKALDLFKWLVLVSFVFVIGCSSQSDSVNEPQSSDVLVFEVDALQTHEPTTSMLTFTVDDRKYDSYKRWLEYNEQEMNNDKWDAWVKGDDPGDFDEEEDEDVVKCKEDNPFNLTDAELDCE